MGDNAITSWLSRHIALLLLTFLFATIGWDQAGIAALAHGAPARPEGAQRFALAENGMGQSKDTLHEQDYRPAREIRRFTEPTVLLRGSAEEIGLDRRTLATVLHTQFLQEFYFLQTDFAFDKTYETWEIGLFACEAWTVGNHYPIAFHLQCTAGSMDEPRHWHYATLGYGPKEKIVEAVRDGLQAIVSEYAAFVRKARGKNES
jgi:hypothetical protein